MPNLRDPKPHPAPEPFPRDEDFGFSEERDCWFCHGNRSGIVGTDWDCEDGVNGPFDGEMELCPCCHGTGLAKDCTFW